MRGEKRKNFTDWRNNFNNLNEDKLNLFKKEYIPERTKTASFKTVTELNSKSKFGFNGKVSPLRISSTSPESNGFDKNENISHLESQ